jgi:hypothetical protein
LFVILTLFFFYDLSFFYIVGNQDDKDLDVLSRMDVDSNGAHAKARLCHKEHIFIRTIPSQAVLMFIVLLPSLRLSSYLRHNFSAYCQLPTNTTCVSIRRETHARARTHAHTLLAYQSAEQLGTVILSRRGARGRDAHLHGQCSPPRLLRLTHQSPLATRRYWWNIVGICVCARRASVPRKQADKREHASYRAHTCNRCAMDANLPPALTEREKEVYGSAAGEHVG